MPMYDLKYEELVSYRPEMKEPADFDRFWADTLAEAVRFPLNARFDKTDYLLEAFETFDVTFSGYGGQPIKAWLILPAWKKGKRLILCICQNRISRVIFFLKKGEEA